MSKVQLIAEVEANIMKIQTYLFDSYRAQLLQNGISEGESIIKIIDVLRNETFESYTSKKLSLNEDYIKRLKTLSILTHFYECESYDLIKLQRLLSVSKDQCMNLLLEASINKLITIKINEESNKILIINSKIRQRQTNASTTNISKGKLVKIKQKNYQVENNICNLIQIVNPSESPQFNTPKGFLAKYMQNLY